MVAEPHSNGHDLREIEEDRVHEYVKTHDPELLAQICMDCEHYVKVIVSRLPNPVSHLLSQEDLCQSGMMGLMAALARFEPSRNVPFRTWAYPRIAGAARDVIRAASSQSRSRDVTYVPLDSISAMNLHSVGEEISLSVPSPATVQLVKAIKLLPVRQSLIMLLSANGLPLNRVSTVLGVSPSKVNQDKRAALLTLRKMLLEDLQE